MGVPQNDGGRYSWENHRKAIGKWRFPYINDNEWLINGFSP
jgi:hypothetical protein